MDENLAMKGKYKVYIEDNSANGTFVNGERIPKVIVDLGQWNVTLHAAQMCQ
jgi:pSer/pThr/pTyr-binding forkhead associated (FHA) protein